MVYRELGDTGLSVSEIGLGCEGFLEQDDGFAAEIFQRALEAGINCMDLYSPNPDLRSRIGRMLRGRREGFVMQAHLCAIWEGGQYRSTRDLGEVRASFQDLLERLDTPYIDIGMIHYVDTVAGWREIAGGPLMEYVLGLKRAGRIRQVGVSSHNPAAALEAVKSGLVQVLMFSVNPCYDLLPADENVENLWAEKSYEGQLVNMDPQRQELYETCQRLGVGITVMKAFGGGDLLSEFSPAGKALTANQCIHYALTRPGMASVMAGVRTREQLEECLAYESATGAQKDYASALASFPRISWEGHCMYCGHCAPCPREIDVAAVTKFLNLARARGETPETVREHYGALVHTAGECVECRACEGRCPFHVAVCQNMRAAKEVFGR